MHHTHVSCASFMGLDTPTEVTLGDGLVNQPYSEQINMNQNMKENIKISIYSALVAAITTFLWNHFRSKK